MPIDAWLVNSGLISSGVIVGTETNYFLQHFNRLFNKSKPTNTTLSEQSNRKIIERGKINTTNIQIHDHVKQIIQ
jgi:hypothetical protein